MYSGLRQLIILCLLGIRGELIMLKNLPIMLCCSAQRNTYYALKLCLLCSRFYQ